MNYDLLVIYLAYVLFIHKENLLTLLFYIPNEINPRKY